MNALDVLNEYKAYLKILARRPNGREKDAEKAKIIIDALEKQVEKKPFIPFDSMFGSYVCPVCQLVVCKLACYCEECGQALDWSDKDDN